MNGEISDLLQDSLEFSLFVLSLAVIIVQARQISKGLTRVVPKEYVWRWEHEQAKLNQKKNAQRTGLDNDDNHAHVPAVELEEDEEPSNQAHNLRTQKKDGADGIMRPDAAQVSG